MSAIPLRPTPDLQSSFQQWMRRMTQGWEEAAAEGRALFRSALTAEGRRRDLAPLLVVAACGGFFVGVVLGLRHHRR